MNGDYYEGEWKDDQKVRINTIAYHSQDGKGKLNWIDGTAYDGEWKADIQVSNGANCSDYYQHGKGKKTWVSGTVYEVLYSNGNRVSNSE